MPLNDDPEITEMLNQLQGSRSEHSAGVALSRYRAEAIAAARDGADRSAKEILVDRARQRLKDFLRGLLE